MSRQSLLASNKQGELYSKIVRRRLTNTRIESQKKWDANVYYLASMMPSGVRMVNNIRVLSRDELAEAPLAF
jgi:hypothetical protein